MYKNCYNIFTEQLNIKYGATEQYFQKDIVKKKIKLNKDRTQQFSGLFSFSKSNIHVFATNHQVKVGYTQAGYLVWENVKQKEIVKASITLR